MKVILIENVKGTGKKDEIKEVKDLEDGTKDVRVAGRIVFMRKMGKMSFLTIRDIEGKIQLSIKIDLVGEENY